MAKFEYAYQKIVDLKSSEKTQAEWLLSAAFGKLQSEETTLDNLLQERESWSSRLQEASLTAVPLSDLMIMQHYVDFIDSSITSKRIDVSKARQQVDDSRTFLSDKMMDEKVWQKSKERALNRFRTMLQLKEQNEMDELATVRYMTSVT
ncbi:flagellar export protein FliJ [Paenibacillus sp. sptzw28]|uniref:flagellar export protein FliJ n=1 Tax=Paenibacillus sp. sptzw28 TaxID=715179 RepID=UPI001C6F2DC0|nr:flagellar export protein FliJ [Paenibacillus sp. sptzw28]QYR19772.1 flagellar export protein FliJ [Paenibacillus sp. sptzw28]